jgi:DNA primase
MGVQEEILFTETAKFRRRKREQGQRNKDYRTKESVYKAPRQSSTIEKTENRAEEKEIIRLMLIYGGETLYEKQEKPKDEPEPVSVGKFFMDEFESDNLEFSHPTYKLIFSAFKDIWDIPGMNYQTYFVNHPDPEISHIAVGMLSPQHELSKIHAKQGAYIRTERSMLQKVVPETLISFRTRMVKQLISNLGEEIKICQKNDNTEGMIHLLEQRRQLDQLRKELSEDLKRII